MLLVRSVPDGTRIPTSRWGWVLALVPSVLACARAPEPEICPRIEAGDLVFSELRLGSDADNIGQFIEVYNASGRAIDLQGVWISQVRDDGKVEEFLVREPLELAAGGYAVIGTGFGDELESWVDYGVGWDLAGADPDPAEPPKDLFKFSTGWFELWSCEELIDEVRYAGATLPSDGTRACGSVQDPPSASENDELSAGCWCEDTEPPDPPLPVIGLPGTPGRANRCE